MRDNSFMRQHVRAAHICASLHLVLKAPFVRSKAASYSCILGDFLVFYGTSTMEKSK